MSESGGAPSRRQRQRLGQVVAVMGGVWFMIQPAIGSDRPAWLWVLSISLGMFVIAAAWHYGPGGRGYRKADRAPSRIPVAVRILLLVVLFVIGISFGMLMAARTM